MVDHRHQLLLNVTGTYPVPDCRIVLETTQLRNLYLAHLTIPERCQAVQGLPQVSTREVNIQSETLRTLAYGDFVWTGECKGARNDNLPQYVLADLEVNKNRP